MYVSLIIILDCEWELPKFKNIICETGDPIVAEIFVLVLWSFT